MKCDKCHTEEASVHLKQIIGKRVVSLNLCAGCAAEEGIGGKTDGELNLLAILDVIAKKAKQDQAAPSFRPSEQHESPTGASFICPECHLPLEEFLKTGLLGCPACYESFADSIETMLASIHRDVTHRGRGPAPSDSKPRRTDGLEIAHLREELARAVATEAYEEAARLRDRIFSLQGGNKAQGKA